VKGISSLPEEMYEELAINFLDALKPFPNTYDESDFILRDGIFHVYIKWGQFVNGAQVLGSANLASSSRPFSETEKVDIYIKCAEAFLEEEAAVDAEVFVNKASPFINSINDWALLLRYRVTYARVLDANRKFIEAALRYYELSTTDNAKIVAEELLELLAKAVTCTILGKSGPQRNRVMGLLYNVRNHLNHFDFGVDWSLTLSFFFFSFLFSFYFSKGCEIDLFGPNWQLLLSLCPLNQDV
jgi:COP9 signalosome complex subunit 4